MKYAFMVTLVISACLYAQDKVDVTPKFYGFIRSWYQSDQSTGQNQFAIKEGRLGVRGNVNEYVSYKLLADFSRVGKLTPKTDTLTGKYGNKGKFVDIDAKDSQADILLDAEATFTFIKPLSITMGQFVVPFSTENQRGNADIDFVNRALLYGNVTPDLRDMGVMAVWANKSAVPVEIRTGLFNGVGTNKTETDKTTNYALRGLVQPVAGLGVSGNYYRGTLSTYKANVFDFGAEFKTGPVFLAGEFAQRSTDVITSTVKASSFFAYALYDFDFGESEITHIIPAVRYERLDPNTSIDNNEVGKTSLGLSFHFAKVNFGRLRVNYELYDYKDGRTNPNQLVIEFLVRY